MTREQIVVEGPAGAMVQNLIGIIGRARPRSVELTYDRIPEPLADDEEPGPEDRVEWTAKVILRDGRPVLGEHIAEPGHNHATGPIYALANVIEQLGGNVVLVDMTDTRDPR